MKLGVVIPLKSKSVAKDWSLTCENLKRTIDSILSQTEGDVVTVVVGHEEPRFLMSYTERFPNLYFVGLTELPPPSTITDIPKRQLLYEKDRCSKILKGIKYLRDRRPSIDYWFPMDADDLIHRNFKSILNNIDGFDAAIINRGLVYHQDEAVFNKEDEFSAYCGSSAIIADRLLPGTISITKEAYKNFLFGEVSHVHMEAYLRSKNFKIFVPHDRLVVYYKGHGENISDEIMPEGTVKKIRKKAKIFLKKVYFDQKIRSDFGL